MSTFYETFARHDGGEGLKAQSTHYCPGCGHGLVHKLLAGAIEELGIQDRTVAVSPVGCSVFLYYYLDAGNTQAAHGRASAVALGHKLANPESVVVSYQGDGDLAAIGLTEILQAAQVGVPISVIFVNNSIYGMTGGQLAPTTLMGQKTTTSPRGRDATMGHPLRMAELIAQLDAPVYVERVALFDPKQRVRAARAVTKALRMQVENRGFSFVEVLAECPTHLKMTAPEAERWVRESMVTVFPLGVKKHVPSASWGAFAKPRFDPATVLELLGANEARAGRFARVFPETRFGDEIGLKLAGAGGDGAQTAALLVARAAINEGFDATHIPSYGPESRGGTSYADVRVARDEVLSPDVPEPHVLVAFNAPSLAKFGPAVAPGATVVYDSSVVPERPPIGDAAQVIGVPCTEIAHDLAQPLVKNIVALGAVQGALRLFPDESFVAVIREALQKKRALIPVNEEAFRQGVLAGRAASRRPS